jgi:hypothetical protein
MISDENVDRFESDLTIGEMQHLILGFFFFSLLLTACAAILTILLYFRYRQSFFLYLFVWTIISLLYAVAESLLVYSGVTITDIGRSVRYVYFSFSFVAGGVLLYVVPRLSHLSVNAALSRSARTVHVTLLGTYWATTAVILLLRELDLYIAVSDLAIGAAVIYGMLLLSLRGRSVRIAEMRSVIHSVLVCGYVAVPLILLQWVLSASGLVSGPLAELPIPKFALMTWLAVLILYYSYRFFFVSSSAVDVLLAEASLGN